MRKSTIILALTLVFFSCTTENEFVLQECSTTVPELKKRSLSEVLDIAQNAISLLGHESRSAESRSIDLENIQYVCTNKNSRSQNSDTLLYVINYAENNGFAVVSANPNTPGLMAVTEKGNYSLISEDINDKTGIGLFMDMAEIYVSNSDNEIKGNRLDPVLELMERVDTTDTYILPKLTTKWGQLSPEGVFCPNLLSGCVNTALAQIMAYFEYPTQMNISYENAPIASLVLDWSEMKKCKGAYNESATDIAQNSISHLCRQLGYLTGSSYNPASTTTTLYSALGVARNLGYTVSSNVIDYGDDINFQSALDENNLILMGGFKLDNTVGHAWVVDGHLERELHYTAYVREANGELWQLRDEYYTYYHYNHINWGDDGFCNGYFMMDVFNKSNAYKYDGSNNSLQGNYTENLKYFLITR